MQLNNLFKASSSHSIFVIIYYKRLNNYFFFKLKKRATSLKLRNRLIILYIHNK